MTTLQENQFAQIEAKLSTAWEFLSGESRCFRFVASVCRPDGAQAERRILLPLQLSSPPHVAGIALLIDREDAEEVASAMFGIPRCQLAEADITDACSEACNVFSGCLIEMLSQQDQAEIGLPKPMEPNGYHSVSLASGIKALIESNSSSKQMTLVIFDPLAEQVQ